MKEAVVKALHSQLAKERDAAITYESLSIWCASNDYAGFAEFFHKQAEEEREHAKKIVTHMLDMGERPVLGPLNAPLSKFSGLHEIAKAALAHEQANTAGVLEAYEVALEEKDYATKLMLEWFIKEQVEEEAWANKLVALVGRAACAGSVYSLDRHIVRELMGE